MNEDIIKAVAPSEWERWGWRTECDERVQHHGEQTANDASALIAKLAAALEDAEAEAVEWKSTAQGLAEELSSRSVEWFIENGGDEADGWSPAQFLARYQPGGEG